MKNRIDKQTLIQAFKASLPTLAGYTVMGIAFGLLLANAGYNFIWAGAMGLIIYGGTMQFVAVDLLSTQASLLQTAFVTFLVHSRHIFYSISMIDKYKDRGKARPYLFYSLTDETYALVNMPPEEGVDKAKYDLYLSILNQIYWICGDMIGALIGSLSIINTEGVDFAMTALFIVIFMEQLMSTHDYVPAVIGIAVAFICLIFFGSENFFLPAMILIVTALLFVRQFRNEETDEDDK